MTRTLPPETVAACSALVVYPAFLIELDFDSGPINMWTGRGTLTVGGVEYLGAGDVLRVDVGPETTSLDARGATLELSCAKSEDISIALTEKISNRPARILFALFDPDFNMVSEPVRFFSGRMDGLVISDDPERPVMTMSIENDFNIINKVRDRRYTHEDQQIDYPGDLFFEFVPAMQDKTIVWG